MRRPLVVLAAFALAFVAVLPARAAIEDTATGQLRIVFAAFDRNQVTGVAGGLQQIYVADGDGTNARRITPDDGMFYDWPTWAFNGTKIVFTARKGIDPNGEEAVYLMNPDGTGRIKLTNNPWRNAQPKITADGRWLIFASTWDESPQLALYRMDLRTMEVEDLTARGDGKFYFESDPRPTPSGDITFAYSGGRDGRLQTVPTQIATIHADGTGFRSVTTDSFYNTDPTVSPDGRQLIYSSYRGVGVPRHAFPPVSADDIHLTNWFLVVRDLATNKERTLNQGQACLYASSPCAPDFGPAWQPLWSPDGRTIGYLGIRSPIASGIYAVDADGTHPRVLLEMPGKSINWWDWAAAGTDMGAFDAIGSARPSARLLYGASVFGDIKGAPPAARLFSATPDRWSTEQIDLGGLEPELARWAPGGKVVVQARVPFDPAKRPASLFSPNRRVHFTLDQLSPLALAFESEVPIRTEVGQEQVFLVDPATGSRQQITTPWTEDVQDAMADDDARGNVDPDVSPDGRYLICTNLSAVSGESFVLRIDLLSGDVMNLTNVTSGAVPVADGKPRFSPDGTHIAFVSLVGAATEVFVMASDGTDVRQLTNDGHVATDPAWSPDGSTIVYASYRGNDDATDRDEPAAIENSTLPLHDWYLVALDAATGSEHDIAGGPNSLLLRPVWSPDGGRIAYIGGSPWGSPDIHVMDRDGKNDRRLQATVLSKEFFVDWR